MLSVGSVVAGYRIERVLGTGGMGIVYQARDPDLPRSDALKILSPELSRDPDFRLRFQREADVAAALDHPNIVAIRCRGEFAGQLWIAMQFVDGTDADAALSAGPMMPARALHVVREVGKALDYAHDHNVVHRDIKPANFLLSRAKTGDERVLLADFGIARAIDATGGLTSAGVVLATVSYAAPEVLTGNPFDGRADLYSLGCTLFRMLTGRVPFSADNGMAAVMMAHLMQPPPRVTDLNPRLPARMDEVIATAMAKDPARRFQSAHALVEAATRALGDFTTPLGIPSRPVYTAPSGNAAPWWQAAPHGQIAAAPGPYLPPQFPAPLPHPPRRRLRARAVGAAAGVVAVIAAGIVAVVASPDSQNGTTTTTSRASAASPPPPIAAPTVPASLLSGLLLSGDEASAITAGPPMWADPVLNNLFGDAPNTSDKDCVGAWLPAQASVYSGTSWDGAAAQKLRSPDVQVEIWQRGVVQAVIGFSSTASAQKFLADQTKGWMACSGRAFTVTPANASPQHWTFGKAGVVEGTTNIPLTMDGGGTCQRALAVRRNVAIDVLVCGSGLSNQAGTVVAKIADKVGGP